MTGLIPSAAWVRPPAPVEDETPSRLDLRRVAVVDERLALQRVLGALFVNTTLLPEVEGKTIGPARYEGQALRWSIWAPHRRVLIDNFTRQTPPKAEVEARIAFAGTHDIRYAVVERGRRLTAQSVKEWLDGPDSRS